VAKTLVIVESPAKAKSISKYLGHKYEVKASMGHVRDLPKSQLGVDVQKGFSPKYITIRGKGDTIKELKSAVKKADRVLLASDPDREGEAIAWHLTKALDIEETEPCRIEFNEITKQAVQDAIKKPRPIDLSRVNAQQARRILDRLVGYNLSPLLWRKVKKGLSAGRVQSVAMRLICDREEEIQAFVQEEYWTLTAKMVKGQGDAFEAKLHKIDQKKAEVRSREEMQAILDSLKKAGYEVTKVVRREKLRHPAPAFTTSSLQQEAYRKLNFTAQRTMLIAQQLYEGLDLGKEGTSGLITYIRTDSTRVSTLALDEARSFIKERYGQQFVPDQPRLTPSKNKAQDAHEAIRPTLVSRDPAVVRPYLKPEQYKLYKLIWERFVASQMSSAVIDTTSVDIASGPYVFRATGSVVKFPGFMQLYIEGRDDGEEPGENLLPELQEGEEVKVRSLIPKQHFTQPPPRYTDATLVKTMEEKGIGRPSTYAPIVETILKRGYAVREKKQLYPTELGTIVVEMLKEYFKDIIDVEFTAELEERLDNIEEGNTDWVKLLDNFYEPFNQTMARAEKEIHQIQVADEVSDEVCGHCGRNLVIKLGRYGKFLACPGFPDCRNTKPLLEPTGVPCPNCQGELVLRRSKKGRKFYGCSTYPECDFVLWDQPTTEKCPSCKSIMIKKSSRGKEYLRCSNEACRPGKVKSAKGKGTKESRDTKKKPPAGTSARAGTGRKRLRDSAVAGGGQA
jgi:DNA topoisomerase-1